MKTRLLKLIDALVGSFFCLALGCLDRLLCRAEKNAKIPPPKKILFVRPGGLGDFLYLLPTLALAKKRFPQAQIHVLAEKRNRAAQDLSQSIDKIILYDRRPLGAIAALRGEKYDTVIDTEQFHRFSAVFAYLTPAKARIGFKTTPCRNPLYTHLIDYSLTGQEAGEFARLLAPLGVKNESVSFKDSIPEKKIKAIPLPKEFAALKSKKGCVALIALRCGDRYRRWNTQKYIELVSRLLEDPAQGVVLIGGKAEKDLAQRIKREMPEVLSLTGKTSLLELSRIMLESDLFIGVDSGIAVLAALLGIKCVTIFGATENKKWAIEDASHKVVRRDLPCSPCYRLGRHKLCMNIGCMEKVSVGDVLQAVQEIRS